jgi:hypothetical protein
MKNIDRLDKLIGMVVVCIVLIAVIIIGIRLWRQKKEVLVAGEMPAPAAVAPQPPAILDYAQIDKDAQLKALMQQNQQSQCSKLLTRSNLNRAKSLKKKSTVPPRRRQRGRQPQKKTSMEFILSSRATISGTFTFSF